MSEEKPAGEAKKKKGGMGKILMLGGGVVLVLGAGIGGGIYATQSGIVGGGAHAAPIEDPNIPKLVKKGEGHEEEAAEGGEGGGHGGGEGEGDSGGKAEGTEGGEKYESTYYTMEKEFTSNLRDSPHFVQIGLSLSTHYDKRVIGNVKNNDIPLRSAILMTLSNATEDQVFTQEGKEQLAEQIRKAINTTLEKKAGFGGIGNVYFTNFIVQ
ncbi:flagellar basal body-associated FliL family protein [Sphingomonas sp. ID0503]|uniref:flagellar basal body-associated FliL family protein n=1 Tax=Sphingomonas sp. ID0503 TaxID=3399691 RepID=UPI003AFB2E14